MNSKKPFFIALALVLMAAAAFTGLFIHNQIQLKNNLKKVALEVEFKEQNEFSILIKSNDGSNFKIKSLPVKITIHLDDGYTETFSEDIVKYRYGDSSYSTIFPISRYEESLLVSGRSNKIYDSIMISGSRKNQPIKSVQLEYEDQKLDFANKLLEQAKRSDKELKNSKIYGYTY